MMFRKLAVANRGEIAVRIIRTAQRLGLHTIVLYSDADRFTLPVRLADEAVRIGPAPPGESYLNADAIVTACHAVGADALHPGYGFLSENAAFAERLQAAGIRFVGPRPEHSRLFGLKHTARELAAKNGVKLLPGSDLLEDIDSARAAAERIGYPLMLKSTAGGGGIGMQLCANADELVSRFEAVRRLAGGHFGDARLYLERYIVEARHIEVQIFGDGRGGVVALAERDCSLQRRHQKLVEEAPAPALDGATRETIRAAALALARSVAYESAGTVEFLYDIARNEPYFLEVNTRLQVEHPVTEAVFAIDLVEWMIRQAAGTFVLPLQSDLVSAGHAIEVRLYAEDPARDFLPVSGRLTEVSFPAAARIDGWVETGTEVTPFYDPLLAKLIVHAASREAAVVALEKALAATALSGIETNLAYLAAIAASAAFRRARMSTATLKHLDYQPRTIAVLVAGAQSSLQDFPGRLGYWHVGVPPSGPMDERSHRLVNHIVGNPEGAAVLECTLTGPTLRFNCDAVIALGGAAMAAVLDDAPVPYWRAVAVRAGQVLSLGRIAGPGQRSYLAIRHGFAAPLYLGSRATFALGRFGGHAGGVLKPGDTLHIARDAAVGEPIEAVPAAMLPVLTDRWEIGVVYGPHGAPDFFTDDDIAQLFATDYEVHFNSDRTGVRLIGPPPSWARQDGGEAGLHPSNIHDNAYAIGAIDFTGDMPIILGPDGPSLGGFVAPAVVARDELWKLGQLKAGDMLRFRPLARSGDPFSGPLVHGVKREWGSAVVGRRDDGPVAVVYRRAGDDYLLVEYGPMALAIELRLRVHLLMQAVSEAGLPGIIDVTPGIRSLQIHYDSAVLSRSRLLAALAAIEPRLAAAEDVVVASRTVPLPLSWNDPAIRLAVRKYHELIRPDAPWCPSNIEFIQRINGLASADAVREIVLAARYLVLGLGDVYLGAPVATPLDPRHRLVTTKYNPARAWTPENAVGIGGAYLCVYGMEGPGGYQLFGRTIQMWNSWRTTDAFAPGTPWLLRFFDQIRFFLVDEAELAEARAAFPHGACQVRIEETRFSYAEHARFLAANADDIAAFTASRQAAFAAERQRWQAGGLDSYVASGAAIAAVAHIGENLPANCTAVPSPVTGNVWKILVEPGATVIAGQVIVILESMKMEMAIAAPIAGLVRELGCQLGRMVQTGQSLAILESV
jgi:urea carboxylase